MKTRPLFKKLSMVTRTRRGYLTKTICGRVVTLKRGRTYVACAPLSAFGHNAFIPSTGITVSIMYRDNLFGPLPEFEVHNLTREGASQFLRAFNNGRISFVGRKWTTIG